MDYTIIDAHAHLWLRQDTVVDGFPIRTLENGRSLFMGDRDVVRHELVQQIVDAYDAYNRRAKENA